MPCSLIGPKTYFQHWSLAQNDLNQSNLKFETRDIIQDRKKSQFKPEIMINLIHCQKRIQFWKSKLDFLLKSESKVDLVLLSLNLLLTKNQIPFSKFLCFEHCCCRNSKNWQPGIFSFQIAATTNIKTNKFGFWFFVTSWCNKRNIECWNLLKSKKGLLFDLQYNYRESHSKVDKVNQLWWGCTFDFFLV